MNFADEPVFESAGAISLAVPREAPLRGATPSASPKSEDNTMKHSGRFSTTMVIATLVLGTGFLVGCGGEKWDRVKVYGDVTYDGEKVEVGTVMFTPTGETVGPAGIADIRNGNYNTDDNGAVPGTHVVTVEGFDGEATEDSPLGSLIFQWDTETTIPDQGSHEFDIKVPAGASIDTGGASGPMNQDPGRGDYGGV